MYYPYTFKNVQPDQKNRIFRKKLFETFSIFQKKSIINSLGIF